MLSRVSCASAARESTASDIFIFPKQWKYNVAKLESQTHSDDESDGAGHWGGGRVATILVSSKVKPAYRSITHYHHESTLRLSLEALGLDENHWPGGAKNAPSMADFFLESRAFLGPK